MELTEREAVFADGTKEQVDVVFYCTGRFSLFLMVIGVGCCFIPTIKITFFESVPLKGYKYDFPFLAESCGIRVDSNMVTPLWKHLVSIENPTLALIGLPFYVCAFSMFDLQVCGPLSLIVLPKIWNSKYYDTRVSLTNSPLSSVSHLRPCVALQIDTRRGREGGGAYVRCTKATRNPL